MKNEIDYFITFCCVAIWATTIYKGSFEWYIPDGSFHYLSIQEYNDI